jgi:hypothetical protein
MQLGSQTNSSAADANVSGTVAPNAGTVQAGHGQELNVSIKPGAHVVIDAVVVKGADGFNVYSAAQYLPPALLPPQHYISPRTGGGNVPAISHWFVCFRFTQPTAAGLLTLFKEVIAPDGVPAAPVPGSYTAKVTCDDGVPAHQDVLVTFGDGGGQGTPILTDLAAGTVCTVVEATGSLPAGTVIRYEPADAATHGVTISAVNGAQVTITNDFSGVAVQHGNVQVEKVVQNPGGAPLPGHFTAQVLCNDSTSEYVNLPGNGGPGTPVVHPRVSFDCTLGEVSAPAGWTVRYSVDGGPASTEPPVFSITSATVSVTVTVTNAAPGPCPSPSPTTPSPTPTSPSPTPTTPSPTPTSPSPTPTTPSPTPTSPSPSPASPSPACPGPTPVGAPITGTAAASGTLGHLLVGGGTGLALAGLAVAAAPGRAGRRRRGKTGDSR